MNKWTKLKNRLCEHGHWIEPRVNFYHGVNQKLPCLFLTWDCENCLNIEAKKRLAQSERTRTKKVIQKSDTKVNK